MRKWSLFLGLLCAAALAAAEYRIEAENFPEKGEWKVESCAGWNLSGKRMLDPKGAKPATAKSVVYLPEAGNYNVWVRAISFGGEKRKCQVSINGKSIGTFGDIKLDKSNDPSGKKATGVMVWEKSLKKLDLPAGNVTVELVALSAYTRVDALILTTDNNFVPSDDPAKIAAIPELTSAPPAPAVPAAAPAQVGPAPQSQEVYRVECEKFQDKGEWKEESCAGWNLSGKRMLDPKGVKNTKAKTVLYLPQAGTYRLWVRAISFGGDIRKCQLLVNGKNVGTFGDVKRDQAKYPVMLWEKAAQPVTLPQGNVTLELVALNPYTRVDAVILAGNDQFVPSDDPEEIAAIPELKSEAETPVSSTPVAIPAAAQSDELYRIEAENFPEKGEWKVESCAGWNLSGKRMLDPKGIKNAKAKTIVSLPKAGTYRLWVRAISFGGDIRKCQLLVNGKNVGTFGDVKRDQAKYPVMLWEKTAQPVTLPQGDVTLELVALSPYTRVDTVILAGNDQFVPSDNPGGIEAITELAPTTAAIAAGNAEAARPKPIKFYERGAKDAPPVLLFHGQRVWTAEESAKILAAHGFKVTAVTTANLDGLGGASLKTFLTDLGPEPPAQDGITPAFAQLDRYKAVIFTALPAENWAKLFTPARVAQLKKYVEDGGVAIFNYDAPEAVAELLPVKIEGRVDVANWTKLQVPMPRTGTWAYFPEKWQVLQHPKSTILKPDAESILPICDENGNLVDTLLASWPVGKGKVLFFNFNWRRASGLKQYWDWGYGPQLFAAIAALGVGATPDFSAYTANSDKVQPRQLDEVAVKIELPNNDLKSAAVPAQVDPQKDSWLVKFANNAQMSVSARGAVKITYPDDPGATVEFAAPPKLQSVELVKLTSDTSEGVGDLTRQKTVKEKFELKSVVANSDGTVDLLFQSEKSEFAWRFKCGELTLEGRSFPGVAHRLIFSRSENKLQSFQLPARVVPGTLKGAVAKRLACYASPRGYAEMDFSGAKKATTAKWNFFGNGQPFTWLISDAGVYAMFPETPQLVQATQSIEKGAKYATELIEINVGRRSAPLTTTYLWHVFAPGAERGHADYIALEQFMRTLLQSAVGLKNLPPAPVADCENTLTAAERKLSMAAARDLGFRYYHLPLCPSSIESMKTEARAQAFAEIKEYGLLPSPWTPADYCEGNSEEVFRNHPDYFLRTADGKFYMYFGQHPVLDMNKPEVQKWYFDIMDFGIANGLGKIYTDMGGTFTINVNAAGEESKIGLDAAIEIYRYFHERNIPISIEGITPLALSNFWYRRQLYEPFAGREYAVIGTQFGASGANAFDLGYFRLAMYCTFAKVPVSGYALDFERFPNEKELAVKAAALIRQVQPIVDKFGMPYVREVECGTTWVSPNGAAVFCFDGVKKLTVEYNGKTRVFTDVKPETVIELD